MGATSWGLLYVHYARRSPFLFRGGVNLPPPHPIGKVVVQMLLRYDQDASSIGREHQIL
jgi:hypothetical protein